MWYGAAIFMRADPARPGMAGALLPLLNGSLRQTSDYCDLRTSAKLISTGVSLPNSSTLIVAVCLP